MKLKALTATLFLSWSLASAAMAEDLEAARFLAPLFFPETQAWLAVQDLPPVPAARLKLLAPKLQKTLEPLRDKIGWEDEKYCSLTQRLFEKGSGFYLLDVNADGREDILFSGAAQCGEGGLSIIWYGDGQENYTIKDDQLRPEYVLRLKPGEEPLKVIYKPGFCADLIDVYWQDAPEEPRKYRAETMVNPFSDFDLNTLAQPSPAFLPRFTEIRSRPEINNEYDADRSEFFSYIFLGNILTILDPPQKRPCPIKVLGYEPSGQWALVVLDESCRADKLLFSMAGGFIRLGWVEASDFNLILQQDASGVPLN